MWVEIDRRMAEITGAKIGESYDKFVGGIALGRAQTPEDVAAFVSLWLVEFSIFGPGAALVLCHAGRVRTIGEDARLAAWLADSFVRYFPESALFPWSLDPPELAPVEVDIDLRRGLHARAADVEFTLGDLLGVRTFVDEEFRLGEDSYRLSNVYAPCREASLTVAGARIEGSPVLGGTPERPTSTAFLAVAEVWSRP